MLINGAELSLQASDEFGLVGKQFCKNSDRVTALTGDDSARLGQEPAFIPSFPSVISDTNKTNKDQ